MKDNTSIDCDFMSSSIFSMVVEPCIICNGEGSYDYVKSIDESVISWADECAEKISDLNNDNVKYMDTVDDCNLLTERCVICHKDNNKNDSDKSKQTNSINNRKS